MFIILALVFYFLVWLTLFNHRQDKGLRQTFLETFLLTFSFIAVTTEVLSLFRLINQYSLIILWFGANLALLGWLYRNNKFEGRKFFSEIWQKIKSAPRIYLTLIGFIYLITLIIALNFPPNTYDSMTYHLSRVANWIQFGSIEFYPTALLRQLYMPPLAEYSILHLQLLSGGDYFANLPQWVALIACGTSVSIITKEFGETLKTQWLAVVLTATLPMAIVQASGTQNDLIVSVFILSFFYFWLRAVKSDLWTDFVWVGISLGLAFLAKGTTYFYCFPIGLIFVLVHLASLKEKPQRLRFIKQIAVILLIATAFSLGHYSRNYRLFGSPVSTGEEKLANKEPTAKMMASNLVRNYAIHLGTISNDFNQGVENRLTAVFGDELNNPNSTWLTNKFAVIYSTHEDSAGNFFHLVLITLALILVFFVRGKDKKYLFCLAFSIVVGFILFSVLVRWQIWASRLHTPLFMLGSILVATVIARLAPKFSLIVAIFGFIIAWSFIFQSKPRPILSHNNNFVLWERSRQENYFRNLPTLETPYTEAVDFIKLLPNPPETIGLLLDYNDYEYPFWVLLKNDFRQKPSLYHVGIKNVSANLVGSRPLPDLIISTRTETAIEGIEYEKVWEKALVKILRKK